MTITFDAANSVVLTSKPLTVTLGEQVMLNQFTIPGSGEYDVAGIQCESHLFLDAAVHLIRLEDLTIAYAEGKNTSISKAEGVEASQILVMNVQSDTTNEQVKQVVKALEPGYLFLRGAGVTPELIASLGITQTAETPLKVTMGSLPQEGTILVTA